MGPILPVHLFILVSNLMQKVLRSAQDDDDMPVTLSGAKRSRSILSHIFFMNSIMPARIFLCKSVHRLFITELALAS